MTLKSKTLKLNYNSIQILAYGPAKQIKYYCNMSYFFYRNQLSFYKTLVHVKQNYERYSKKLNKIIKPPAA